MTRHEIYRLAIDTLEEHHPEIGGRKYVASRLGMTYKALSAVLDGQANMDSQREEMLAAVCEFPELFELKKQFVFPNEQSEKGVA